MMNPMQCMTLNDEQYGVSDFKIEHRKTFYETKLSLLGPGWSLVSRVAIGQLFIEPLHCWSSHNAGDNQEV